MMSISLKLFTKMFLVIIVIFTVFLYLFAIVLGPALFYFTPEGQNISLLHMQTLPVWLLIVPAYIPIGLDFGVIFFGLWSIFIFCFVAAWKVKESFHKTIKESITKPTRKLFSSSLFALPIINSMTFIAIIIIQGIQEAGGIPTGTSPIQSDPFLDFVDLSYAAVSEELGFRLIPIGAFLIIYLLVTKKKEVTFTFRQKAKLFFMSFLFPDKAKRAAGKKTVSEYGVMGGISLGEWGIVVFTSVIFGLAHFDPGVSWEIGKVTSAGFAGLVMGLSFLAYGFQASIIIHWFFNAYTDTFFLFTEIYPAATPFANSVIIISIILGILGWSAVATLSSRQLVKTIQARIRKNRQKQATPNTPIFPQLDY